MGNLGQINLFFAQLLARQAFGIAAQQNIDTTTGHVGGNGDRAGATGLGDDRGLTLVVLGVEHFVVNAAPLEQLR